MIKNKIEINFSGTNINFHFGLGFIGRLVKKTGKSMPEILKEVEKNAFWMMPILMDEAAKYEAYRNDDEYKYSELAFIDLIDELGGVDAKEVLLFMGGFVDSITKGVPKEKQEKDNKSTKKKLS